MHPVSRPSVERVEAGRFLGHQRLLQGDEGRREERPTRPGWKAYDHTELPMSPPTRTSGSTSATAWWASPSPSSSTAARSARGPTSIRRDRAGQVDRRPQERGPGAGVRQPDVGPLPGPGHRPSGGRLRPAQPAQPSRTAGQLAQEFQESGYDVKQLIRWIMASQAYQLSSIKNKGNEKDEALFSHMQLKPMTPEQLFDSLLTATSRIEPATAQERPQAQTPGCGSSSSPSATTRATRSRAFRARFPRRS